jgi:outer membrane lipoprotein-sorting protein
MSRINFLILLILSAAQIATAAPDTKPADQQLGEAPKGVDPTLWSRMLQIDARAGKINTLIADFQQEKHTALLKKPLVSSGELRIRGSTMRWETRLPQPSILVITEREARILYPNPAPGVVEIYNLDQRIGELAASPLPRLAILKNRFHFEQIPVHDMDANARDDAFLALKMTPIERQIAEHVEEVRVLLDVAAGYIVRAEMTDADGDRTVLKFTQVKLGVDPGDLELKVPAGANVTRPLEGLQTQGRGSPSK